MSNNVVLLADGKVVRYKGNGYTIVPKVYELAGSLSEFTLRFVDNSEILYIYISNNDLYIQDQKKDINRSGYYKKADFTIYRNSQRSDAYNILEKSKLKESDFIYYQVGDLFEIEIVEFKPPYTAYFTQTEYKFKIQNIFTRLSNPIYYPQTIDTDPNSPTYNIKTDTSVNLLNNPRGKFYTKNFGERLQDISENKEKLSELMTRICFRISSIRTDGILDIIAINSINDILDPSNWPNLPLVDQFVGNLLRDWGEIPSIEPSLTLQDP